jgi:hypothetical protein
LVLTVKAPPYEVYLLSRTALEWLKEPDRDRETKEEDYLRRRD